MNLRQGALRWISHLVALYPLAHLALDVATSNLSPNPIQDITYRTGKPALVLLVLSLAVTPAMTVLGWRWAQPLRRRFGLYSYTYAAIHFLIFVGLDYLFDPTLIQEAIFEKPYALAGFTAFLLLTPLAVTSTKGWMRRLGQNWKRLHRLAYLAALLAVVHYVWLVKSDIRQPLAFGFVVLVLMVLRLPRVRQRVATWRHNRTVDGA